MNQNNKHFMKVSSDISKFIVYAVIIAMFMMVCVLIFAGNVTFKELIIIIFLGYIPAFSILYYVLYSYVDVHIDTSECVLKISRIINRNEFTLIKDSIIYVKPLGMMRRSPTYIIKYKK